MYVERTKVAMELKVERSNYLKSFLNNEGGRRSKSKLNIFEQSGNFRPCVGRFYKIF